MFKNAAAEFVATRTYLRWNETLGRRETWPEATERYIKFITKDKNNIEKVIRKIRKGMLEFEVMPSMRAVWAAGPAAEFDNTCIYNCSFANVDSVKSFSEALYILMCGTGVGFSSIPTFIDNLPTVPLLSTESAGVYNIQDNKAGWADSVQVLLNSLYSGKDVEFNYSNLRPKGSRLLTMGGRSSGPEPLIKLHYFIRQVFNNAQGRKLTTLECHDIMNVIGEIVVVGGVRRSSEISLSELSDQMMRDAKVGTYPLYRAMANNSAIYRHKPTAVEFLREWAALASSGTGERGIFNLEAAQKHTPARRDGTKIQGTNPCVIGETEVLTDDGYKRIDSLVDQKIIIWNGFEWSEVIPKVTGYNQPVVTVSFSNGHSLTCTEYHRFRIQGPYTDSFDNPYVEKMAKQLRLDDRLIDWIDPEGKINSTEVIGIKQDGIADTVYCFNEPKRHLGIFNGVVTGQCGEILLRDKEFCNLSEVVLRSTDDVDSLLSKVETATWIGCLQSTYTNFPYLSPEWKVNCEEERLLGVSITGQMDNAKLLSPSVLKAAKSKAFKVAKHASEKLGINMPVAINCVKPSGTVSQLVDSSSGLHPRFSDYYIRRYRISSTDPLYKMMRSQGIKFEPENGEEDKDESKVNTWIVSFPIASPKGSITRDQMSAIDQLEHYKKVQTNWCEHNASATIYCKDSEWFEVGNWVYTNWDNINGLSFLPFDGGTYKKAPYEECTKEKYNELVANFPKIDYSKLSEFEKEDNTQGASNLACSGNTCEL